MHSRSLALLLAIYLCFGALACSKKNDQSADQNAQNTADQNAANTQAGSPAAPSRSEEPRKPRAENVTVPEGTTVTVRLTQSVGSKISQPGQSFAATLANPVEVNGKAVIPAGSAATGTVVDAKPLGRFKGGALLQLQLTSITIHGTDHPVQTAAVSQTLSGKGKRTAVLAGGGAGLGALVGALAGGGKGAAIGAAAGAGAGGAGAAFTGNKEIVLPAESAVSFKLTQAVEVKE